MKPFHLKNCIPSQEIKSVQVILSCVSPGYSNHSARHHPDQVVFNSEEGSVGTTIAERNPKPLGAAQRNINAKLPGGTQHTEGQQICGTASQGLDRERTGVLSSQWS